MRKLTYESTRGRKAGTLSTSTTEAFTTLSAQKSEPIEVGRTKDGKPVLDKDNKPITTVIEGFDLPNDKNGKPLTAHQVSKWATKNGKVAKIENYGGNKVVVLTTPPKKVAASK